MMQSQFTKLHFKTWPIKKRAVKTARFYRSLEQCLLEFVTDSNTVCARLTDIAREASTLRNRWERAEEVVIIR